MSEHDLKKLYELVIDNDDKGISELLDIFQPVIYKNSYISGELDLDCVQELNIKLYTCVKNFKFKSKEEIRKYLSNQQFF